MTLNYIISYSIIKEANNIILPLSATNRILLLIKSLKVGESLEK